jgi:hypothetical protein
MVSIALLSLLFKATLYWFMPVTDGDPNCLGDA